jgi:hypothetical protein
VTADNLTTEDRRPTREVGMSDGSPAPVRHVGWTGLHTLGVIAAVGGLVATGAVVRESRLGAWVGTMAILVGLTMVIGLGLTGSWLGVLVDSRNRLSFSRLQLLAWTVLVLPAASTAMLANVAGSQPDPLDVTIPRTVWLLMGLSTTSLAATPLIRSTKEARPPNAEQRARTLGVLAARRGGSGADATLSTVGQVVVNVRPQDARLSDLFAGEEVGSAAYLDLGKVQLCYVTLILILAYAAALVALFGSDTPRIAALPELDSGLIALLGISHAGYLTTKAFPQSRPAE